MRRVNPVRGTKGCVLEDTPVVPRDLMGESRIFHCSGLPENDVASESIQ